MWILLTLCCLHSRQLFPNLSLCFLDTPIVPNICLLYEGFFMRNSLQQLTGRSSYGRGGDWVKGHRKLITLYPPHPPRYVGSLWVPNFNWPFPSCPVPLFQNESKCKTFHMKMSLICIWMNLWVKLIFMWKVSHLNLFWNRGKGNSEMAYWKEVYDPLVWQSCVPRYLAQ